MTTIETIREQNRIRAKRYYDKHKETIAQRRKESRGEPTIKEKIVEVPVYPRKDEINKLSHDINLLNQEVKEIKKKNRSNEPEHKPYPYTVEGLTEMFNTVGNYAEKTRKYYIHLVETLFDILPITKKEIKAFNFLDYIKDYDRTIDRIKSVFQSDKDELYSTNSQRGFIQTINQILKYNKSPLPEAIIDKYNNAYQVMREKGDIETEKKNKTEPILDFNVWLKKIEQVYKDPLSKERMIALFYDKVNTFRDDLQGLYIVNSKPDEMNKDMNYIEIPDDTRKNAIFYLNAYKTGKKYGSKKIDIDKSTSNTIRKYIKENNLITGNYLFGKSSLSNIIGDMNRAVGIKKGSINLLRRMIQSTRLVEAGDDPEKILNVASKASHSSKSTKHIYKQQNVVKEIPITPVKPNKGKTDVIKNNKKVGKKK